MITIEQAAALLAQQDDITILCHRSPDGDTAGSGFALAYGLLQLGKRAHVRCADPFSPDITAVVGGIENGDWQERFVVAVDTAEPALLGGLEQQYATRVDLVIDHHRTGSGYGVARCVDTTAAATVELITALLVAMQVHITPQIAACLYMGLATDTGCFRYANTTAATLHTAAMLLECGAPASQINCVFFETKNRKRIAIECRVLQQIEYHCNDRCAVMVIPATLMEEYGVSFEELDGLSSLPRQIEGVWVGVTIREQQGECRVSVRTSAEVDASAVCAAFGGGGHLRAAGCTICAAPAQACKMLVAHITLLLQSGGVV